MAAATSGAWAIQTPTNPALQYTPETPEDGEVGNVDENHDEPANVFVDTNNAVLQAQLAVWWAQQVAQQQQQQQPQGPQQRPPVRRRLFN